MYFKQFYLESLGHASYLVGDERAGQALVLDPQRRVKGYFGAARAQGLRITHAIDTHGHNDYLSGLGELTARADVEVLGFSEADLGYTNRPIKDGEIVELGDVAFEVVHTPGHTPEHISLLVYDRTAGEEPALMLSGGALLVGDLARPDLLGGPDEARSAAREFCHTIQEKILWRLADHIEVWPTHVSGSLCGGNIGSRLSTTVGFERKTNAVLSRVSSSEEFVEECIRLDNLPAVPPYWRRMRHQNLAGPSLLGVLAEPPALKPADFKAAMTEGVVLDARSPEAFAGGHVPGALNVGLSTSFSTWAGTVLEEDARVLLVLEEPGDLWEATWQLLRIGYDAPAGWLSGGMQAWRTSAERVAQFSEIDVHALSESINGGDGFEVLDVRQPAEWADAHIEGAHFITGGELPERLDEVPADRPVAVMCGSGYRSSVIASYLVARGIEAPVYNVIGGMGAWRAAGYPTVN